MVDDKVIYENYEDPTLKKFSSKWPREASRGIVRFPDGDILIFFKKKIGQYKLLGGGRELYETPEETFIREIHEESGYDIKNIRKIGITKGYTQTSHIFLAEPNGKMGIPHLDDDEIKQGAQCIKISPEIVLERMKIFLDERKGRADDESLIQYYITLRDYRVLKYIFENIKVCCTY